jgi:rSAM/selenodomain-associated transferase 2
VQGSQLSIIIPCYRDDSALAACLQRLAAFPHQAEILVVDGLPNGATRGLVQDAGAVYVASPKAGRGTQLATGAEQASRQVLLFLHCDCHFTATHLNSLEEAFQACPAPLSGCFYRDFSWQYPQLTWMEAASRWWQREVSICYGDQAQFFHRQHYDRLGGYPDEPIMEDVILSHRMRAHGSVSLLDPPLRASVRRFQKIGWLRAKLRNLGYLLAHRFGASPRRIYRWYYGRECE